MRTWRIAKFWEDSTVFILGGGPSLSQANVDALRGQRVIAVNDAFKLGKNWINLVWFSDCRWYVWNYPELMNFKGMIVGCPPCHCDHTRVLQVTRRDQAGLSHDPEVVFWNKNSGASAINLAYLMGASRIVLLGFDMHAVNGKNNWHTNHKHVPRSDIYTNKFLPCFDKIARDASAVNLQILNATPNSAIEVFPRIELMEVLK